MYAEQVAMSEYQYYEWQTVDRSLTYEEQAAVEDLSSHIDVSSSQQVRIQHLADKYASRHALIERWEKRGWV